MNYRYNPFYGITPGVRKQIVNIICFAYLA